MNCKIVANSQFHPVRSILGVPTLHRVADQAGDRMAVFIHHGNSRFHQPPVNPRTAFPRPVPTLRPDRSATRLNCCLTTDSGSARSCSRPDARSVHRRYRYSCRPSLSSKSCFSCSPQRWYCAGSFANHRPSASIQSVEITPHRVLQIQRHLQHSRVPIRSSICWTMRSSTKPGNHQGLSRCTLPRMSFAVVVQQYDGDTSAIVLRPVDVDRPDHQPVQGAPQQPEPG